MNTGKFIPTPTGKTYNLGGYSFKVYSINGFSFNNSIDISSENGLYCFTNTLCKDSVGKDKKKFKITHALLYLGKSDSKEGIDGRLVQSHEKFPILKKSGAQFLSIYECSDKENAKEIESEILSKYYFQFNEAENEECAGKKVSVEED